MVLVGLFAGAGAQFVGARLALDRMRREGADVPGLQTGRMSQEWRRFRHPHLPPSRRDQGRLQEVARRNLTGGALLAAALGLLAFLVRSA